MADLGAFLYLAASDPSVGRHLCFERDKKQYRGTKNDITGQKTISRDISFLCHRVIHRDYKRIEGAL